VNDQRMRMLATAGLIAGLTLGSITLSNAAAGTPSAIAAAAARRALATEAAGEPVVAFEAPAEPAGAARRLPDLVAALTGMDARDVAWQRLAGLSLTDIAHAKGLDRDEVVAVALREFSAALDTDVASGRISADQKYRVAAQAHARFEAEMAAVTVAAASAG
jgi:hypothetical protein